jgi:lysozyme
MAYDRTKLIAELERDEDKRPLAYDDNDGKIIMPGTLVKGWVTVGIGRNLIGRGLEDDEIAYLLDNDIAHIEGQLDTNLPWWRGQTDARQRALINLSFMGIGDLSHGLLSFRNMLAAWQAGDYQAAAEDLLKSKYAEETGMRAQRIAELIKEG